MFSTRLAFLQRRRPSVFTHVIVRSRAGGCGPWPETVAGLAGGMTTVAPGLRENPARQAFFEHPEYLAVRAHLPAPWQDILDLAYYSGWRKNEILGLTWDELDEAGGVIRLSPARSKTLVGRILPISQPIAEALARRRARRDPDSPLVFHGVVARIVPGPHDAHRQDPHRPMRYDTGRPRAVIRFKISQPRTASLPCPAGLRARRPSPMMDL